MKKTAWIICILLLNMSFVSKAQGIQFKHGTFEEILTLAKNENKLVFIDFHTEWCAPCKMMARTVFMDPKVAEFYNKEFICCKLDAENEGAAYAKEYEVNAYPSLVFVNATGEMVYKKVGALDVDKFMNIGAEALKMVDNSNSYAELKKLYPQKTTDEEFLKKYVSKMIQYGDIPVDAIEAYLTVQKGMKENSTKMMEFLLKNARYLICGGKAESILKTNYKEFFDIATRNEEKVLAGLEGRMIKMTRQYALYTKNPDLYQTYLNRWTSLDKKGIKEDYNDFKLELIWLKNNKDAYKTAAIHYLDSIVTAKKLDQIRADDMKRYKEYVAKENGHYTLVGESVKETMKVFEAQWQTESILKVGQRYLTLCTKKGDYKKLMDWTTYGLQLIPEDYKMTDFQAKIYLHQGNKKKALELKKQAVNMMTPTDKEIKRMKLELEEMEKGTASKQVEKSEN